MTTITPRGLTTDRVQAEARSDVEDRFLLSALVNVALAIVLTAVAVVYDLPAAFGGAPDRSAVAEAALRHGTALSVPIPLIVLLAIATMIALQGERGRTLATAACGAYGVLALVVLVLEVLGTTSLTGATVVATTGLQLVAVISAGALAFTAVEAVREG